jgi:hypothetical protein
VEWFVSQVAESFHISPLQARAEIEDDPAFVIDVMEMRAFAAAKADVDRMDDKHPPDGDDPLVKLVLEFLADQLRAKRGG